MTPLWLEAHASYMDTSRTATAQQLTFNAGSVTNAALLKVPMIPAGFLKPNTPLTVEIIKAHDVNIGKVHDSDIRYGISDGRGTMAATLPVIKLKGALAHSYPPEYMDPSLPSPVTLSIPASLCSRSNWMNAGARVTLRMTEAL